MRVERLSTSVVDNQVRASLTRLDELIFDLLRGTDTWCRIGDSPYTFYIRWGCHKGTIRVHEITGTFKGDPYRMEFIGLSKDYLKVTLMNPTLSADFSSNLEYGSFSVPGLRYLRTGNACYQEPLPEQPDTEFFNDPYNPYKGESPKKWLMTDEVSSRCASFINDLVTTITSRKAKKSH